MTPEWSELKAFIGCTTWGDATCARRDILEKMHEIEKRTLPERVARLLENFSHTKLIQAGTLVVGQDIVHWTNREIIKALRTGDTSELEKWQKEKS